MPQLSILHSRTARSPKLPLASKEQASTLTHQNQMEELGWHLTSSYGARHKKVRKGSLSRDSNRVLCLVIAAHLAGKYPRDHAACSAHLSITFNFVSIRSMEFPPTIMVKIPGSTTRCMSRFRNESSSKPRVSSTVLVSPGFSAIRRKPRSSFTGRVTELIC